MQTISPIHGIGIHTRVRQVHIQRNTSSMKQATVLRQIQIIKLTVKQIAIAEIIKQIIKQIQIIKIKQTMMLQEHNAIIKRHTPADIISSAIMLPMIIIQARQQRQDNPEITKAELHNAKATIPMQIADKTTQRIMPTNADMPTRIRTIDNTLTNTDAIQQRQHNPMTKITARMITIITIMKAIMVRITTSIRTKNSAMNPRIIDIIPATPPKTPEGISGIAPEIDIRKVTMTISIAHIIHPNTGKQVIKDEGMAKQAQVVIIKRSVVVAINESIKESNTNRTNGILNGNKHIQVGIADIKKLNRNILAIITKIVVPVQKKRTKGVHKHNPTHGIIKDAPVIIPKIAEIAKKANQTNQRITYMRYATIRKGDTITPIILTTIKTKIIDAKQHINAIKQARQQSNQPKQQQSNVRIII